MTCNTGSCAKFLDTDTMLRRHFLTALLVSGWRYPSQVCWTSEYHGHVNPYPIFIHAAISYVFFKWWFLGLSFPCPSISTAAITTGVTTQCDFPGREEPVTNVSRIEMFLCIHRLAPVTLMHAETNFAWLDLFATQETNYRALIFLGGGRKETRHCAILGPGHRVPFQHHTNTSQLRFKLGVTRCAGYVYKRRWIDLAAYRCTGSPKCSCLHEKDVRLSSGEWTHAAPPFQEAADENYLLPIVFRHYSSAPLYFQCLFYIVVA